MSFSDIEPVKRSCSCSISHAAKHNMHDTSCRDLSVPFCKTHNARPPITRNASPLPIDRYVSDWTFSFVTDEPTPVAHLRFAVPKILTGSKHKARTRQVIKPALDVLKHSYAAAFLGVAFLAAAVFFAGAFLVAFAAPEVVFCLLTRPELVFLSTVGTS